MRWFFHLFIATMAVVIFLFPAAGLSQERPKMPFEWINSHQTHFTQKTTDGGFIVAGQFWTPGGNQYDFWVLRLNKDGTIAWQKTYGGGAWDIAFNTQQTADGGYVVAGTTESFGAGDDDAWVLKLDQQGNVVWQKTYGGKGTDYAEAVRQTEDGGYIVVGTTASFGDGLYDMWLLKLTSDGSVAWQKTYGGKDEESDLFRHIPIEQTTDGGFIVAGSTRSFGSGGDDFWVLKLNADGSVAWQKTYGTGGEEYPTAIGQNRDGGYFLTGTSNPAVDDDWQLQLDSKGNIVGVKTAGKREIVIFDTTVAPRDAAGTVTDSAATVSDTTEHMEIEKPAEPESPDNGQLNRY